MEEISVVEVLRVYSARYSAIMVFFLAFSPFADDVGRKGSRLVILRGSTADAVDDMASFAAKKRIMNE